MNPASGLVLYFTRCNAPARSAEWTRWLLETHVPQIAALEEVRAVTQCALTQQPTPGMPSVGFSHVTLIQLVGDIGAGAQSLRDHEDRLRLTNAMHPNHCVMNVDVFEAHGRFSQKSIPTQDLSGHIMAYVMCNDPRLEAAWDVWNDEVHMPDMLTSNAFTGLSRWRRHVASKAGPQFLTLYDVGPIGVAEAVNRSAAIMPGIVEAGRKHPAHVGGLTVTLTQMHTHTQLKGSS